MHSFEAKIEKMKPTFEKIASNPYVSAIRDGFIAAMPIILFSSIFTLIAYVPNAWGFYWSKAIENALMLPYNYSMGLLALFVTATTAKNLTDYKNLNLPKVNQINPISVIMAAEISFFIVAVKTANGGVDLSFMGTKGLIAAYVVGLIVPNIYYFCVKNNVTINMPDQVPQNISQTFKDVFPMAFSVALFWVIELVLNGLFKANLSECVINLLSPLFSASDSYLGLSLIARAFNRCPCRCCNRINKCRCQSGASSRGQACISRFGHQYARLRYEHGRYWVHVRFSLHLFAFGQIKAK